MNLLRTIELFLRENGMAPTRFGREAVNDPRLVHDLREGRELRSKTQERVLAFIAQRKEGGSCGR